MGANKGTLKVDNYVGMDIEEAMYAAQYLGLTAVSKDENSNKPENEVIRQSIEKDTMVDEGTEIILYFSNGKSPEGEVDFTIKFPSNSDGEQPSGRYSIDFIVYEETMRTVSTDTFILPIYTEYTQKVKGSGDKIKVVAYLNGRYKLGEYVVDFGNKTYEVRSEDVVGALTEAGSLLPRYM